MKFWNFKENGEEIELRIDGEIVSDDDVWFYEWLGLSNTSTNAFKEALNNYKGKDINVWIDSYGGDVFAAAGIYNALMEHKGNVTVKIDGKAMSAASVIAMAGGEIQMSPLAVMMIHNPLTMVQGDMHDLRHTADVLDTVKDAIINAYQIRTGKSRNEISEMMDAETWMSAKSAIKDGFADKMMYADSEEPISNFSQGLLFNRLAIQNSAAESIKRLIEVKNKKEPPLDDTARLKARLALECEI